MSLFSFQLVIREDMQLSLCLVAMYLSLFLGEPIWVTAPSPSVITLTRPDSHLPPKHPSTHTPMGTEL